MPKSVPATESFQLMQRQRTDDMNTAMMSVNNKQHSTTHMVHMILEQLIYDCTRKARKAAIPVPSVKDQNNAGGF